MSWLVRWLPRELRRAYGPDVVATIRARLREERRVRGWWSALAYGVRALADLVATGARMRFGAGGSPPGERRPGDRRRFAALLGDARFALRTLLRAPAFTLAAVATLACGVAVTTAVVGIIDAALWRPQSPFADPGALVAVYSWRPDRQQLRSLSYPDYLDLAASDAFSGLTVMHRTAMNMGEGDSAARVAGELVSGNYFDVLGVSPVLGRGFARADEGLRRAVISHALYRRLGEQAGAPGASVRLNGHAYTIVGVAPPRFRGTRLDGAPDVWVPVATIGDFMAFFGRPLDGSGSEILATRGLMTFDLVGRLAPGVGPLDAQARVDDIAAGVRERFDGYGLELRVTPQHWGAFRVDERGAVTRYAAVLGAVAAAVLLIGCINVANLLLARAADRRAELALRRALGASSTRLFAQVLTESVVLAALSGAVGLALVAAGLPLLRAVQLPAGIDVDLQWDARIALLGAGSSILAVVLFGLLPALRTCFGGIARARRTRRVLPADARFDARSAVVAVQLALAVALVVTAALMTRTWINLANVDAGFEVRSVLTASIDPELAGHDEDSGMAFYRELLPRLDVLPGVRSVAITTDVPLQRSPGGGPLVTDATGDEPQMGVGQSMVTPGYFDVLGIEQIAGRGFTDGDTPSARPVVVINRAMAQRYWPGVDPLGRTVRAAPGAPPAEIVGVVADYRHASLRAPPAPHVYWPQLQVYSWLKGSAIRSLLVATSGEPGAALPAIRAEVAAVDAGVPLFDVATLQQRVGEASAIERQSAALLSGLAAAGFLLAGVGLFGSLSYALSRRRVELGVRAALGASPEGLFAAVVRTGLAVAAVGGVSGLLLSAFATRAIDSWLFGVGPWDAVTLAVVAGLLALVAVLATLPVALRAAASDPLEVMRAE